MILIVSIYVEIKIDKVKVCVINLICDTTVLFTFLLPLDRSVRGSVCQRRKAGKFPRFKKWTTNQLQ